MCFVSQFASNEKAHQLFYDYVRFIVGRTNRYTGKKYVDDPAIMSWQVGNEPRAFSDDAKAFRQMDGRDDCTHPQFRCQPPYLARQ